MYKNKKAWLRIIEAFIAILIVATVLFLVVSKQSTRANLESEIAEFLRGTLKQIAQRDDLREAVLTDNIPKLKPFIEGILPIWLDFDIKICDVGVVCALDHYPSSNPSNIYTDEVLIVADKENFKVNGRKLKLFVWRV